MEVFKSCPKCGNPVEPTWHQKCETDKKAVKQIVNPSNKEHLHYFCKCGYDFTVPILDEAL